MVEYADIVASLPARPPRRAARVAAALCVAGLLSACGLKGPLYLPPPPSAKPPAAGQATVAPTVAPVVPTPPPPRRASESSSIDPDNRPVTDTQIP